MKCVCIVLVFLCLNSCEWFHPSVGSLRIGAAEVSFDGRDVLVRNFPRYRQQLSKVSWGDFSFEELDRFIYDAVCNASSDTVCVLIEYSDGVRYGNGKAGKRIVMGRLPVMEGCKYVDFDRWNRVYASSRMFWKDKGEYDVRTAALQGGAGGVVVPAYEPRDLGNGCAWVFADVVVGGSSAADRDSVLKTGEDVLIGDRIGRASYAVYFNSRFDYRIWYPSFLIPQREADNGDGRRFVLNDRIHLSVWGEINGDNRSLRSMFVDSDGALALYRVLKGSWFVLSGYTPEGLVFYRKTVLRDGVFKTAILYFPPAYRADFEPVIKRIFSAFPD